MTHNILVSDPISEKGLQSLIHHPILTLILSLV